ncbi:histone [Rhizosphaericola mali]|uniref:Histone n=1 Tax=Rhizosphaericola mali TaxID=2545455 RepID=A0A5P2G5W5_9BACT|nr:histone [Rhizosphaericola mali]QES89252.1 histone [Rhizosphaericola mali]
MPKTTNQTKDTSKRVSFSPEVQEEIKKAIIAGGSAKELSDKFGITTPNYYYYKAQIKKAGTKVETKEKVASPKVATAPKKAAAKKEVAPKKEKAAPAKKAKVTPVVVATPKKAAAKKEVVAKKATPVKKEVKTKAVAAPKAAVAPKNFVIGDTKVTIGKNVKSVDINKGTIKITF